MKILTKLLTYYSTFLCVVILGLGIITSRESSTILLNLVFLPVLLYLLFETLSRKNAEISEKSDITYLSFIAIFIALFLFGVYNVHRNNKQAESVRQESKTSPIIIHKDE